MLLEYLYPLNNGQKARRSGRGGGETEGITERYIVLSSSYTTATWDCVGHIGRTARTSGRWWRRCVTQGKGVQCELQRLKILTDAAQTCLLVTGWADVEFCTGHGGRVSGVFPGAVGSGDQATSETRRGKEIVSNENQWHKVSRLTYILCLSFTKSKTPEVVPVVR